MNAKTRARIDSLLDIAKTMPEVSLERIITIAIMHQDAETRKACAEAVEAVKATDALWSTHRALDAARNACMNVQAI